MNQLIATTSIKAFNQGLEHGRRTERERIKQAAQFVAFEDKHGKTILSLEDLMEELQHRDEGR